MGRAFEAAKLDETAAQAMGVNVTRAKLLAFSAGAFVAGVGGGLYAHHAMFIQYDNFDFERGVDIAMYLVLGGMDVFYGPLLGAFIMTYLATALQFLADWRWEVWGIIVILVMIFRPQGLLGRDTLNIHRWVRTKSAVAS
jgi:branched-chain amino acid transport system permease protein